ncbi:MAG: stage IV sporulation protein A [Clostridia bacterium]|nr:stage IV sporulation protein A [Clostridia bacterium]
MTDTAIYKDIAGRTHGDVYIGVVGPVRSGKSTFIKRFMESVVIPNIRNDADRERSRDELPQSAGGRSVMTTEPKFIPDEGVNITVDEGVSLRVKIVDCVGYMIPDAQTGGDGGTRMVHTPWHSEPVTFEEAAEYGTRKVIAEHATIGMLVTSDGSVGDFPRDSYRQTEERVANELTELGKPFAVILNSAHPEAEESIRLAVNLEEKYRAPVALVNCLELDSEDIMHILEMLLDEFPVKEADILLPAWTSVLPEEHRLKRGIYEAAVAASKKMKRLRDIRGEFSETLLTGIKKAASTVGEYGNDIAADIERTDAGCGTASLRVRLPDGLYYDVISEITGIPMKNETDLLEALEGLSAAKREFDKYRAALAEVNEKGYGIVMPCVDDLHLEDPEIVRQAGGYGVRLRASASSVHMIKTNIETEINPIVGTEQQSEEMVKYLMREFEDDPKTIWQSNMFGKSLYELVNDGLHSKLDHMPEDARQKFGETLSKIINEGSQGLICIIL